MRQTYFNINQQNKPKRSKSKLLIFGLALVVILVGTGGYLWVSSRSKAVTQDTVAIPDTSKKPGAEGDTEKSQGKQSDQTTITNPPETVSSSASMTITETTSNTSGVRVASVVAGFAPTRCIFSFNSPDSRPVVKETDATGQSCGPLEVRSVEFDKIGEWDISITAYSLAQRVVAEGRVSVQ